MIDWKRVQILHQEVGAEDFDEILELFLEEVEGVIVDLPNQMKQVAIGESLHFLKGSALSVGFSRFSELCGTGEAAAANGEVGTIDIDEITQVFDTSKQALLAGLPQLNAAQTSL
jgi:HPt (histidine-containing phosphotransfer) domain-containing protein